MNPEELMAAFEQHHAVTAETIAELQDRLDQMEARANRPAPPAGDRHPQNIQAKAAFSTFLRSGDASGFSAGMSEVSDPDGGYTVPTVLADQITDILVNGSPMRRLARVEKVSSPDFSLPVNKRGGNSGWSTETGDRDETNAGKIGLVTPGGAELFANVPVTNWLLDDSKYDIASYVLQNVTDEFNVQENAAFVLGDASGGIPKGFLVYDQSYAKDDVRPFGTLQKVPTGSATAITADSLVDLVYAVRAPYRQGDGVAWLMNSTTMASVRKLKSGDGDYLWRDSLAEGQPATLLGFPVEEAEDMPAIGAGATPIAFGNWRRGYVVTDIHGQKIVRDPYSKKGWTIFYVAKRTGGAVLDSSAIKLLEVAVGE